ncbi:MAG: M28 family metallopeptidase [Actinomycetota bacterium]
MFKRIAAIGLACLLVAPAFVAGGAAPAAAKKKNAYIDLKKVPKPKITGKEIIAGLEEFVEKYPLRQSVLADTPVGDNIPAAEFLAKETKKLGYDTRIIEYEGEGQAGNTVRVVEAVKKGTKKPNEWIAFVAHYDTIASAGVTIQGAYDDGSGTNIMRYFAKAFSKIKTNRSIALIWFDGEETGLTGSELYTNELPAGVKFHAVMGFDMVGIGYPARYCICIYHGPVDAALALPIIDYVNFDFLKFPEGDGGPGASQKWPLGTEPHVCSCGVNIRNSDESNFAGKQIFTMRWTGMRTASDYPGYHQPWDTVPFMELVAGGRENLEQGTENTFLSAYYTTFVLDHLP